MSSKIKVDTIENVAGSGNVSLGSGHNLVVPGTVSITGESTLTGGAKVNTIKHTGGTSAMTINSSGDVIETNYNIDQWRLTNTFNTNSAVISGTWARPNDASYGRIGTGMTESSGVFTFPITGLWLVSTNFQINVRGADDLAGYYVQVSTDSGNTSDIIASAYESNKVSGQDGRGGTATMNLINVTNASTFQVFFKTSSIGSTDTHIRGAVNENQSMVTFERKGPAQ